MDNIFDTKIDRLESKFDLLEETNHQVLDVLKFIKTELTEFKSEVREQFNNVRSETQEQFNNVRSETQEQFSNLRSKVQEQFEFLIENAVTKTELAEVKEKMATKEDLLHFTDRFDAKFTDLKQEIIQGIRAADKKFLKFAL